MINPATLFAGGAAIRNVLGGLRSLVRPETPAPQGSAAVSGDSVSISKEAFQRLDLQRLLDSFRSVIGETRSGDTKSLSEIGQDLQADLAGFKSMIGDFFRSAGIDTSTPLVLQPDGKGSIRAVNDHPDAAAVNELFDGDNPLTARLMVMAARASLLDAAATEPGFKAAYEADPRAAIRDNIGALKERLLNFQLRVQDGEISTQFA